LSNVGRAYESYITTTRQPEILEADLTSFVLELANWGMQNVNELTWINTPPEGAVKQARELLNNLEALDENKITSRGREMLELPTHPRISAYVSSLTPFPSPRGEGWPEGTG
ncbi:MAG: hypothetical protein IPK96_14415, partial [Flammeovirgaceae bacterium]|nr:hypothetical protein [Flammeovirgaceae bacterium]